MAYAQRLERDSDAGVKEAFRVLHQGLSCLAGQISATDSHSAHVAAQLTNNWEQMARRLCEMRVDLDDSRRVLDARVSASEKTAQYNSSALEHALEKIEAFSRQRAMDQADNRREIMRHEQLLERLSDAFLRLEKSLPDTNLGQRLDALEATVSQAENNKADHSTLSLLATLQAMTHRLEALEKNHALLFSEPRSGIAEPGTQTADQPSLMSEPQNAVGELPDFEDIFAEPRPVHFLGNARLSTQALPDESRPRYLYPLAAGLIVVLALAAGLWLQQRVQSIPAARTASPQIRAFALPEPPGADDTQFVIAPQPDSNENNPVMQRLDPGSLDNARLAPPPLKPHAARPAKPVAVRTKAAAPKSEVLAPASARDRVERLAAQGNVLALTVLGLRAADGSDGATPNWPDAVKYLTKAAEKGQAMAQYRLGSLYEHGQGVAMDLVKAAHWYELSAAQGNRKAMHNLAVVYASRKDMADAARWFAKAAQLGLPDSQFNLAILYERGDGVPQSLVDALKWYSIAAAQGDAESRTRMGLLQSQLSDADKAMAAKAAQAFHPLAIDQGANVAPQVSELPSG